MIYQPGDKLNATTECPSCGGRAKMKLTKNRTIFVYCKGPVDSDGYATDPNGGNVAGYCGERNFKGLFWSRRTLREIKEEEEKIHAQYQNEQTEKQFPDTGEKCSSRETNSTIGPPRTFTGKLKHFLIADE